jgi:AcrR family transcriptional regulator
MEEANWSRGRPAQKLRTRQALMDAAVELVQAGQHPTVSAVADRVGVSRATAYRYFPSQDLMLSEATIRATADGAADAVPPAGAVPATTGAADPAEVAAAITRQAGRYALDHEDRLRTSLRLSLDPQSGYQRPGRRGRWVDEILASAGDRLDPAARARLSAALNLVLGVDAIIVLTDIAGLDRDQVLDVLEWAAVTLVRAAMSGGPRQSVSGSAVTALAQSGGSASH